jgi:signal transduction histidine kinase
MEELKSNLLRAVAHDIRSPMTAVRAAAEMLTDDGIDLSPEQRRRLASALRRGLRRLDRTVEDSLAYAELKAGGAELQFDELDAGLIVENAAEVARAFAEQRAQTIEVSGTAQPVLIVGDQAWLIQMLINVLTNATERAPAGSCISVDLHRERGAVAIDISNDGPPISTQEIRVIFEEYYRGREPDRRSPAVAGTTGLGLAAAKRIAEEHGGGIGVASPPGGRTTFTVTLPAANGK